MSQQISLEDIFLLYKDRIAVVDADCAMSYGELDELSAALAETLLPYRHSGNKVILVLDRSIEALVAISAATVSAACRSSYPSGIIILVVSQAAGPGNAVFPAA
ncbi:amino acid adenylation domain-containing protein [Salmonella enterica]|nr:amino acid adenylation domain-containing protein [Salmonella enterica]